MSLYPKIPSPFKRFTEGPQKNEFDTSEWTSPELESLSYISGWTFTEKLDGTNIRILWDGYSVTFKGRTDKAQIPPTLLEKLEASFPEELLEQNFSAEPVVLYGEGVGPKIQSGGKYGDTRFVLFDVRVGKWWLERTSLEEIAKGLGVELAPYSLTYDVFDAIDRVRDGLMSVYGDFYAEGLVGVAPLGLTTRVGNRIQVKVKHCDFHGKDYDVVR
jgi:hypothetical protein